MYAFLDFLWPFAAAPGQPCPAIEVDVVGLSGMALLEWLGDSAGSC